MFRLLTRLIEDNDGVASSMRIMSMVTVLVANGIAVYATVAEKVDTDVGLLVGGMLAAGLGGKVLQKRVENGKKNGASGG